LRGWPAADEPSRKRFGELTVLDQGSSADHCRHESGRVLVEAGAIAGKIIFEGSKHNAWVSLAPMRKFTGKFRFSQTSQSGSQ
jgi:hypothetical protein